jgi:hypothetical protein
MRHGMYATIKSGPNIPPVTQVTHSWTAAASRCPESGSFGGARPGLKKAATGPADRSRPRAQAGVEAALIAQCGAQVLELLHRQVGLETHRVQGAHDGRGVIFRVNAGSLLWALPNASLFRSWNGRASL